MFRQQVSRILFLTEELPSPPVASQNGFWEQTLQMMEHSPSLLDQPFGGSVIVFDADVVSCTIALEQPPCLRLQREPSSDLTKPRPLFIQVPVNPRHLCQLDRDAETTGTASYDNKFKSFLTVFL